jgi:competence protein ComGC
MRIPFLQRSAELLFGRCLWPWRSSRLRSCRRAVLANDHVPIGRSAFRWERGPLSPRESLPMRRNSRTSLSALRSRALTLIEVLVILAVLAILVFLLLPQHTGTRVSATRINCVNNLKQVGLAFRIWAGDNNELFPMQVSTNQGGTREWIGGPNAFRHFEVMSNELLTPKVLFCPAEPDRWRVMAALFVTNIPRQVAFASNTNLSYFVGVDAVTNAPQMFLSGDHNVTNGILANHGLLKLTTNHPAGWTRKMHDRSGNVGLADGSVQMFSTLALQQALMFTGVATNRLALP